LVLLIGTNLQFLNWLCTQEKKDSISFKR